VLLHFLVQASDVGRAVGKGLPGIAGVVGEVVGLVRLPLLIPRLQLVPQRRRVQFGGLKAVHEILGLGKECHARRLG
jgi:hypothetical protein